MKQLKIGFITFTKTLAIMYDPSKSDEYNAKHMQMIADKLGNKEMVPDGATIQPFNFDKSRGWDPRLWLGDDYPNDDGFDFDPDDEVWH